MLLKDYPLGPRVVRALAQREDGAPPKAAVSPHPKPTASSRESPAAVGWEVEDTDTRLQEPLRPDTTGCGV